MLLRTAAEPGPDISFKPWNNEKFRVNAVVQRFISIVALKLSKLQQAQPPAIVEHQYAIQIHK